MADSINAEYLFQLAREKSAAGRATLANVVNDLFDGRGDTLTDREKRLMFNILESLIHEVEASVRKNLSQKLAGLADAPHDLIVQLANDEIDVAYPILSKSAVLKDSDLIDIIRLRTREYHLAITLRNDISEEVSDALVETGAENVIESLLANQNARISGSTMEYLVEQSKRVDTFQEPLLHRTDLSRELAQRMFTWVSAALRSHIVARYAIDQAVVDDLLAQATQEEMSDNWAGGRNESDPSTMLANTLKIEGMINPRVLVRALTQGEVALFIAMFSEMTKLNPVLCKRALFDEAGEGFAIACKSLDMPELDFAVLFRKSRAARPKLKTVSKEQFNKVMDFYRMISAEDSKRVVQMWKDGAEYTKAIKVLNAHAK